MAILPDRTELTAPADGDLYMTTDVSDTTDAATGTDKKITWSNIKATLKTYFDTLYSGPVTTIVGITGTKAQFDTACSDGNFLYVGDVTGISDGDKGDITVSASGATWTIDNGAVTLAKQADMATSSVVYRKTAGSGAPEVQTLATLKTDLGLTGTNSGDQTSIVGITGTKSQFDDAVTDGNFMYVGDAPTAHTHLLAAGATDVTATATELNVLDGIPATLTATELGYVDGVTSAIQTQLDAKLPLAGGTMTGNITLGENTSIDLDPAGSADGKYSGICITGTAGATLAFGDLIYLAVADSRWELTDADATATAGTPLIGMCVLAAAGDGSATKILLQGTIRADAKFPALTVGAPAYVGETAGAIQTTIPTGADNVIRVVGRALTADELYFCPSQDYQVTVA